MPNLTIGLKWIVSMLLAWGMQRGLDAALPADASRSTLIVLGGLVALVWSRLDDLIAGSRTDV